jgi:S-adenosylmethionine decarboxylase
MTSQFGFHLTLDLYECPFKLISSLEVCYNLLNELPDKLQMRKLIPPYLVLADSNESAGGKDPGGITGYVIIAESHISIHTFAKRGFVSMDLYSCKKFDHEEAISFIKLKLRPKKVEINKIDRGLEYPDENLY